MAIVHPGFHNVAVGIAQQQGIPLSHAYAILAHSTRNASAKARRRNPRLNRVKRKK